MHIRILVQSIAGLLLGGLTVALFTPRTGSFWGNTFFGIPFQIAVALVPLATASSAALGAFLVIRNPTNRQRSPLQLGLGIGTLAFMFYYVFHIFTYAFLNGFAETGIFAFAFALFGGIFFLPICCCISVATEFATNRYLKS